MMYEIVIGVEALRRIPRERLVGVIDTSTMKELTQEELDALLDTGWTMEEIIEEATK